ncbi:MAG: sugar phosphate isomerase/epimerase [Verrucomicrobiales bacterium]|nr:sugar phosphate isomerase/epimerase [Verrucomicrobiales bacterium]
MLEEIRELGFEYSELSHGIRLSLLPGIIEAVEGGVIKISTLHNFCPLPIGINHAAPNVFRFTSKDRRERERAFRQTLQTLDLAQRLGARLVVLHMGSIEMREYTDRLLEMIGAGQGGSPRYERLCAELEERRQERREVHENFAYEILGLLEKEAASRNLQLGIENREALEEIPFEVDFGFIFMQFNAGVVRYWHDTGHGQIKENLGFINHAQHVAGLVEHLAGFHIHDVAMPGRDHLPPGRGMIDFPALAPFVKPGHIKVLELHPSVASEEVLEGLAYVKSVWGEA